MKIKRKFSTLSAPAKASMVFMIANIFQKGLNFLTAPINTRILSTSDYGTISLYDSWYAMISVFAMLSLYEAVFGVGMTDFKEDRDVFSFSMLVLSNIATAICGVVYFLFPSKIQNLLGLENKLIILMLIAFWFYPALYFWTIRQRFEYKYKACATVTILTSILMSGCSILAVLLVDKNKADVKILVNFIVILPVLVVLYLKIMLNSKFSIKLKYWWYALKFNIPLLPHYVAMYLLASSDRVMIAKYINEGETGVYDIACKFNSILSVILSAINGTLTPWTYECLDKKKYKELRKVTTIVLFAIGLLCTTVSLVIPEAVQIIASEEYYRAIYAVPALSIGMYFSATYFMISNVEFYHKSTVFSMIATIISAIVNIGLNAVLLPRYGFTMAAYTTCFSYFIQVVLHYFNMRRVEKEKVYNMKFIFVYSIFITISNLLLMKIYNYWYIRYGLVVFLGLFILIKRKSIVKVIGQIKGNNESVDYTKENNIEKSGIIEGNSMGKSVIEEKIAKENMKTDNSLQEKNTITKKVNVNGNNKVEIYIGGKISNKQEKEMLTKSVSVKNDEMICNLENDDKENKKNKNKKRKKTKKNVKEYVDEDNMKVREITIEKINTKKILHEK